MQSEMLGCTEAVTPEFYHSMNNFFFFFFFFFFLYPFCPLERWGVCLNQGSHYFLESLYTTGK
jgi:hypothetical protein